MGIAVDDILLIINIVTFFLVAIAEDEVRRKITDRSCKKCLLVIFYMSQTLERGGVFSGQCDRFVRVVVFVFFALL